MKNLELLYNRTLNLPIESSVHLVLNANEHQLAYISTNGTVHRCNLQNNDIEPIHTTDDQIIGLEYLPLNDEICIATSEGDVSVVNLRTETCENVTFCNGGIERMSWSPDQEIVVFITKSKQLVVMNSMYDPIYEGLLDEKCFGVNEFVNVGWGKKETQFHGTEGKEAAKKTTDVGVALDIEQMDKSISVVWRGDCEYFAVSFIGEAGRMFKVFNKEGSLQFTSEKCSGLEAPVFWRPSGSWIAIPQILPNKYAIALFEKNGLRHREIILPFKANEEPIKNLSWSSDSEVLAVQTYNISSQKYFVYLYTICNYHWYMKQCLQFDAPIVSFLWDSKFSEGKSLHVLLNDGTYNIYRWEFSVNHTIHRNDKEPAIVSVIDGVKILLTDFRQAVVPPPMCTVAVETKNPLNFVGFLQTAPPNSHPKMFSIDSVGTLTTFDIMTCDGKLEVHRSQEITTEVNHKIPLYIHHFLWINDETFIAAGCINSVETNVSVFQLTDGRLVEQHSLKLPATVVNIVTSSDESVVAQTITGSMFELTIKNQKLQPAVELFKLPDFCEKSLVHRTATAFDVYSLKCKQSLFWNDRKIATDVTSMFMTERYLAFTTLDQLKFIRLCDNEIVSDRRMERGGKLVTIVPKGSRTILQMPRGNLEAIQPRVLSLCIVGELLDASDYKAAFNILRTQRINLNVLVDHNPGKFQDEIEHFIDTIDNSQRLSLFLFDLQNADVTETMYSSNYTASAATTKDSQFFENKIQIICCRICDVLIAKKSTKTKYVLPIITAYVKQNQLEAAMLVISDLRKQTQCNNVNGKTDDNNIDAQGALKYLLYLVDVNQLYNVALGMYDFDLVLFVAAKSQKDPKEYLPFLNELKQLDETYRKFKIDLYLKRYRKALQHIVKCAEDKFDECLQIANSEKLHAEAMRLYEGQTECYRKMAQAYAEVLRSTGKVRDACLMYERCGDLRQAMLSAKHILDWEKCLTLANRLNMPKDEIVQLVTSLIPALKEAGNHSDAAELALGTLNDLELCIRILCDGRLYQKAMYVARMNQEQLIGNKNRRKHERKLLNLKEGNPFEDIALIDALHTSALSTFDQQKSIRIICRALVDQGMDQLGVELQRVYGKALVIIKNSLDEIWLPEMIISGQMANDGNVDYESLQDNQHYSMINLHQRFKPQLKSIDWELDILRIHQTLKEK
ncbi:Elongator complex protein 1 [Pseudolycoriella hygida]|uniref:Elongator complex protein 1 n=1 Tax=Pseudolycoriella hygida TaxID=35572 RepID=A0A9Q0MSS0_9DIPT|nr:Elongator complex protein 1 [Pseudolycoriella hygida]